MYGVLTARIKHRQITSPVVYEVLKREVGEELARMYLLERVDEKRLFSDLPALKEKLVQVEKEVEYVRTLRWEGK